MFAIGGVGIFQFLTGRIFSKFTEVHNNNHEAYTIIFLFYAAALFLGLILYLKSKDRLD